jgi:hypothetical protein
MMLLTPIPLGARKEDRIEPIQIQIFKIGLGARTAILGEVGRPHLVKCGSQSSGTFSPSLLLLVFGCIKAWKGKGRKGRKIKEI